MSMQGGGQFVNYAGKKPPPGQAERRIDLLVPDQHERNVHLVWDKSCGGCVGVFVQFRAPWIPDIKYLKIVSNGGFPTAVEWQYKQLLDDNRMAWDRWFQDLRKFGGRMNGVDGTKAYQAALEGKWEQVPKALLEECGWTPESEDLVKAAIAGNKWVLGFSTIVPEWAAPLVHLWEMQKARAAMPLTNAELDRFRDADGFDEEFDAEAMGGRKVAVKAPAVPEREKRPTTRREVRMTQQET